MSNKTERASKELTLVARLYLEQLRFPEITLFKKPSLASRIDSASFRFSVSNNTFHAKNKESVIEL